MKLTKETCDLIAEIENFIGRECYNPNSYDGWSNKMGRAFRYPVIAPDEKGNSYKIRTKLNEDNFSKSKFLTPFTVQNMKYILGSNELFIGKGIIYALEYIEKRYGIDFAELEEKMKEAEK